MNCGGGSGGSVYILVIEKIRGCGSIRSDGGDGFSSVVGVGGGGCIFLLIIGEDIYGGVFSVWGGNF